MGRSCQSIKMGEFDRLCEHKGWLVKKVEVDDTNGMSRCRMDCQDSQHCILGGQAARKRRRNRRNHKCGQRGCISAGIRRRQLRDKHKPAEEMRGHNRRDVWWQCLPVKPRQSMIETDPERAQGVMMRR